MLFRSCFSLESFLFYLSFFSSTVDRLLLWASLLFRPNQNHPEIMLKPQPMSINSKIPPLNHNGTFSTDKSSTMVSIPIVKDLSNFIVRNLILCDDFGYQIDLNEFQCNNHCRELNMKTFHYHLTTKHLIFVKKPRRTPK